MYRLILYSLKLRCFKTGKNLNMPYLNNAKKKEIIQKQLKNIFCLKNNYKIFSQPFKFNLPNK